MAGIVAYLLRQCPRAAAGSLQILTPLPRADFGVAAGPRSPGVAAATRSRPLFRRGGSPRPPVPAAGSSLGTFSPPERHPADRDTL